MRKKVTKKKKAKAEFKLSVMAVKLIARLHDVLVKEVTRYDKKAQKGKVK